MHNTIIIIFFAAIAIGFMHTLMGPDHYIPIIAIAKIRKWTLPKTALVTLVCGSAHVFSAAVLGIAAVVIGISLTRLNFVEAWRNNFAAWLLIIFGFLYLLWSMYKNKKCAHYHNPSGNITLWVLILIFVLGPCEPLIPIILYPAIAGSMWNILWIVILFSVATITTMLSMVMFTVYGVSFIKMPFLERYGNTIAGAIICCSGLAIKFLGL